MAAEGTIPVRPRRVRTLDDSASHAAMEARRSQVRRATEAWHAQYQGLGCFSGILYFGGLVVGLFVSVRICEIVIVTILHPPGGYFVEGLRYADSYGDRLTNGEDVPAMLHLLTPPLFILLMFVWMVTSLFAVVIVKAIVRRLTVNL